VDSEGIGALDENQTHDTRIFALTILLSSCFIYNSVGSIDENALQNLNLIVNLTNYIELKASNAQIVEIEDYSVYFPSFFWVVRDFTLQLVDPSGAAITSKEYLERALAQQPGLSESTEEKNKIRRLLTSFFKERSCITLVRPLTDETNLQNLEKMDLEKLRPEFFQQIISLRQSVLGSIKVKTINRTPVSGAMYIELINQYVAQINMGSVPNIENTWHYICRTEN